MNISQPVPKWRLTEAFRQEGVPAIKWIQKDLYEGNHWSILMDALADAILDSEEGVHRLFYVDEWGDRKRMLEVYS